ncbi:MAG: hypothetical protein IJ129_00045, partial [Ruminococcus sp.]|nr:hypothetical protein [Ruminococcus sp.]
MSKHNAVKRTLAGILAVLCVAGTVPAELKSGGLFGGSAIVAGAEDFEEVSSFQELRDAVQDGRNCKLVDDIVMPEIEIIFVESSLTIDLNGHTIDA